MMNSLETVALLSDRDLLARTHELVDRSCCTEADLLVHLGEVDERKLYLERAFPSMFEFCLGELRFSEDAAYSRIMVARAARRLPAMIEAMESGQVHLTGLRLLAPHLTADNHREVLAEAARKTKREIEELVARLAPRPAVAPTIRKLPERPAPAPAEPLTLALGPAPARPPAREEHRRAIAPLAEKMYRVEFTADQELHDKLRQAQDLLRHRIPDGDLACIVDRALDLLIDEVKKERFAVGRKPRQPSAVAVQEEASSRHIPDKIRREVYERDGGRCTFLDERGRRCPATGYLQFDHEDGFALTHLHDGDRIRLLCRAHNQHAAEKTYGRAFMERARSLRVSTCSGTGRDASEENKRQLPLLEHPTP
jgi:5-methylcytosine-specific restriction endonuclease McrA